jgi:NADPH:quinone reductase-like Zn-dependent oxidoreductase
MEMVQAMVWTQYGSAQNLKLREVPKPMPAANEVLIKVHAATVTLADCELRAMRLPFRLWLPFRVYCGLLRPSRITILGQELAGEVEAVGEAVTRVKVGEAVFAPTLLKLGAYAEYKCLPEKYIRLKPPTFTFAEAATIPTGGVNAATFIRDSALKAGEQVLINGAGGSIGTYAVQIAKARGAQVTAVDSAEKLAMLRAIGADAVIDYTQEDFAERRETYDVIIDVVGKRSFGHSAQALKPKGRYILGNPSFADRFWAGRAKLPAGKSAMISTANYTAQDYAALDELFAAGKLKAVIDRTFPLTQLAEAHRYVEQGHKQGNVVIAIA